MMFFYHNFSRKNFSRQLFHRNPWALMLIVSAMFMVACDQETTITETLDATEAEVAATTETTTGTNTPSSSPAPNSAVPSDRKAVPTSTEVKAAAEAKVTSEVVPETSVEDISENVETLQADAEIEVIDAELSKGEMIRYEAIETAIADENLESLMGYCVRETCTETFYTFLNEVANDGTESLWNLEVITHTTTFLDDDDPGIWDINPNSTQVLCSTTRPMVVNFDGGEYTINHISAGSPQSYAFAGIQEPDALYWQVCHGEKIIVPDDVPKFAAGLGYDLSTEPRTVQQDFIELLEP